MNVGTGLGFALCARERVRADGPFALPAFAHVVIFAALIVAPTSLYLYWAHPAWSWMYLVDPARIPGLAVIPLAVGHAGLTVLAWYVGARLIRAGKQRAAVVGVVVAVAGTLALLALFSGRLGVYGSYADFARGTTLKLMKVKLGYVLVAILLGMSAAAAFVALELLRDSRRARPR